MSDAKQSLHTGERQQRVASSCSREVTAGIQQPIRPLSAISPDTSRWVVASVNAQMAVMEL